MRYGCAVWFGSHVLHKRYVQTSSRESGVCSKYSNSSVRRVTAPHPTHVSLTFLVGKCDMRPVMACSCVCMFCFCSSWPTSSADQVRSAYQSISRSHHIDRFSSRPTVWLYSSDTREFPFCDLCVGSRGRRTCARMDNRARLHQTLGQCTAYTCCARSWLHLGTINPPSLCVGNFLVGHAIYGDWHGLCD